MHIILSIILSSAASLQKVNNLKSCVCCTQPPLSQDFQGYLFGGSRCEAYLDSHHDGPLAGKNIDEDGYGYNSHQNQNSKWESTNGQKDSHEFQKCQIWCTSVHEWKTIFIILFAAMISSRSAVVTQSVYQTVTKEFFHSLKIFNDASRKFEGCLNFEGCFMEVSRLFQGSF